MRWQGTDILIVVLGHFITKNDLSLHWNMCYRHISYSSTMARSASQMEIAWVATARFLALNALTRYQHNECYTLPSPHHEKWLICTMNLCFLHGPFSSTMARPVLLLKNVWVATAAMIRFLAIRNALTRYIYNESYTSPSPCHEKWLISTLNFVLLARTI